jgi:hypothetical protein
LYRFSSAIRGSLLLIYLIMRYQISRRPKQFDHECIPVGDTMECYDNVLYFKTKIEFILCREDFDKNMDKKEWNIKFTDAIYKKLLVQANLSLGQHVWLSINMFDQSRACIVYSNCVRAERFGGFSECLKNIAKKINAECVVVMSFNIPYDNQISKQLLHKKFVHPETKMKTIFEKHYPKYYEYFMEMGRWKEIDVLDKEK